MIRFVRVRFLLFIVLATLSAAVSAFAVAPTPTDPMGMAMGFLPGTFPTTVTAANMKVEQFTPAVLNGSNQNNLRVSFPAAGPIKWTESRHNEGDIALLIGPGDPNDPDYFPPTTFFDNYRPLAGDPAFAKTTIAWRVNQQTGAALATVRHNGVNWGNDFTYAGSPVGTIHGIAYFNQTGAAGWGYRMNDGVFNNGGNGSTDLQIGMAGFDDGQGESSSSVAVAYFPYEQGWTGAWVNSGADGEATFSASSPGLPTSSVVYTAGVPFVKLPGVNSATDGMLFVAPTHDDNNSNIAAAFPNNEGWTVSVREDDNAVFSGDASSLVPTNQNSFQFLYVPYSTSGLIGGHVNGATGAMLRPAGDNLFDLTRTADGKYAVSVYQADGQTKLTENDGMLIMSVAGAAPQTPTLADRKFMSYEYDGTSGDFLVESRELVAIGQPIPPSENQFGDELGLRDVNFYFAWVSFTNPLAPGIPGDYNGNGSVDAADYVAWRNAGPTDTLPNDPTPGMVDASDYTVWQANFGRSSSGGGSGAGLGSQSVPEPTSLALCAIVLGLAAATRRARRSPANY